MVGGRLSLSTVFDELPDRPSEAVFQWGRADVEDLDLSEPGIDAGHLFDQ